MRTSALPALYWSLLEVAREVWLHETAHRGFFFVFLNPTVKLLGAYEAPGIMLGTQKLNCQSCPHHIVGEKDTGTNSTLWTVLTGDPKSFPL